jgi:hypothetical protein
MDLPDVPCPFHELTGLLCPLCGGTRAALRLLDGDLAGSLGLNVLLLPLAAVVAYVFVANLAAAGGRLPAPPTWLPRAVALVLVAFTVVRNLPGGELLGPPG